jgi:hypothetical protein
MYSRVLTVLTALGVFVTPGALRAQVERAAPLDRGIGVVYFESDFRDHRPARESLVVRSAPLPSAPVIARVLRDEPAPGRTWNYALEGQDSLVPALLEFDYEIQGLPLDSVLPDEGWARVILGHDRTGQRRTGWVGLAAPGIGLALWREALPAREWLYFTDSVLPIVFDAPDGQPLRAGQIVAEEGDYSLYAEEVRGDWMRVRIVSPDDSCGREVTTPQVTVGWIRYLDRRERPLVWYYTRGC